MTSLAVDELPTVEAVETPVKVDTPSADDKNANGRIEEDMEKSLSTEIDPVLAAVKEKYSSLNMPPLHAASYEGKLDDVKVLLKEPGVSVNQVGGPYSDTALICACCGGHTDVVKHLLSLPSIEVNARTGKEDTALGEAARRGKTEVVKVLLECKDVDVNADGNYCCAPLHYACLYGHVDIVAELLKQPKININARNLDGETPLHSALVHKMLSRVSIDVRVKVVNLLVSHPEIKINIETVRDGYSSLHYASMNGHIEALKILLSHKDIDINTIDNYEKTSLDHAMKQGLKDVIEILKGHDAVSGDCFKVEIPSN